MPSAVETCTCGASIVVEASMVTLIAGRLDEFRAAHSVCRERGPITQPEAADAARPTEEAPDGR